MGISHFQLAPCSVRWSGKLRYLSHRYQAHGSRTRLLNGWIGHAWHRLHIHRLTHGDHSAEEGNNSPAQAGSAMGFRRLIPMK